MRPKIRSNLRCPRRPPSSGLWRIYRLGEVFEAIRPSTRAVLKAAAMSAEYLDGAGDMLRMGSRMTRPRNGALE